jgi:hypothetical protein
MRLMRPALKSRGLGLLIIAVVLAVAAEIPDVMTRNVPGIALAAPVEAAPAVGDCITDPIDPSWNDLGLQAGAAPTYIYPQVAAGRCQGRRYGEITAIIPDPTEPVVTASNNGTNRSLNVADPNMDICEPASYQYVGIPMTGTDPSPLLAGWSPPLLKIATAASTPSLRQQAAGQHWLACIVQLQTSAGLPAAADQERYDRTIRNALFTGQERDRLGLCVTGEHLDALDGGEIVCTTDHHSEVFGSRTTGAQPVARTDLLSTCRQVVTRLTNMDTIVAAGLTVEVVAADSTRAPITATFIPAATRVRCGVSSAGHRALVGSLLELGSRPIPWK